MTSLVPPGRSSEFVTPLDYYQLGQNKLETYFEKEKKSTSGLNYKKLIKKIQKATVVINTRIGVQVNDRSTGIIVNDGKQILTTAHSNHGNVMSIEVIGSGQRVKQARISHRKLNDGAEDWALLDLRSPFPESMAVPLGKVKPDETIIMLGFPEHLGKTRKGRVVQTSGTKKKWYRPLEAIVKVEQMDGKTFFMKGVAGSLPQGGGSGGPLFNTQGELVGVYMSYLTEDSDEPYETEDVYKEGFYKAEEDGFDSVPIYTMRGMSVDSIARQLLVLRLD